MADIALHGVTKRYPNGHVAVHDIDLDVTDGELLVLVGPSGCGKSTLLRMVAGLEEVTEGQITIGGHDVTDAAPKDRDIAMVFQSYALYPHLTVRRNIGYPLKLAKLGKAEIDKRVEEAARLLQLEPVLDRRPAQLSGGQRQRVAMGRAIVRHPRAFLMDEPLSNLDAKLRVQMRAEIARLQRDLAVTTIYVTHDQVEAMTMGDRIVVMHDGLVQQVGTPATLYNHPANLFVAGFLGSPAMNFFEGELATAEGVPVVRTPFGTVQIPAVTAALLRQTAADERQVVCGVRPEDVALSPLAEPSARQPNGAPQATVDLVELVGSDSYVSLARDGLLLQARVPADQEWREGQRVGLAFNPRKLHFFSKRSGANLVGGLTA